MKKDNAFFNNPFFTNYRLLQFITGIAYIIMALLALKFSDRHLIESARLFGVFSVIKGIFELLNRERIKQRTRDKAYAPIVLGIIDILIGAYMIIYANMSFHYIPYLFGIWFISDAVVSLFTLDLAKKIHIAYYWVALFIYLVGALIGVVLLIGTNSGPVENNILIGIYFLMFGFIDLIGGMINTTLIDFS